MSRATGGHTGVELALALPARQVELGTGPRVRSLGTVPRLLAITDDWVVAVGSGCPGDGCRLRVVSVTRDDVLVREVAAPEGWSFLAAATPGRSRQGLSPVRRRGDEGPVALARVVAGGETALLVQGTEGVDLDAGLVDDLDGSVRMVVRAQAGERVWAWAPGSPARVTPAGVPGDLPEAARLVCVCG
jgi:hypothetical protein